MPASDNKGKPKPQSSKPEPVRSMTGYGRAVAQAVTAEIRAVNGRFLKLGVKLPGRYSPLEDRIKTVLAEHGIKRGNVDVSIFFNGATSEEASYTLDTAMLQRYAAEARAAAKKLKLKDNLAISALLPLPGVVRRDESTANLDDAWKLIEQALLQALSQFDVMRQREGASLVADIRKQLQRMQEHRAAIVAAAPQAQKNTIAKFKERIARLLEQAGVTAQLNSEVIEREVVMLADRMDVSEELARLQSHFDQLESTLGGGSEVGKRLDFLTQELLRETNTVGSKAQDEQITHRVVDMKGLIEKIREQVQNLE